jgi:flagellar protein FlgJ
MDSISPLKPAEAEDAKKAAGKKQRQEREKGLRKACADFESVFLYTLFKTMRRTIPESGLLGRSSGRDTYEMWFDQKVAEKISEKKGGVGLQDVLFRQMSRIPGTSGQR